MTNDTTPSQPPDERFTELSRHVQARDIAWLRERHGSGDLAWLAPQLGPSVYRDLGQAIDVGDIASCADISPSWVTTPRSLANPSPRSPRSDRA